jgi:UDPglucose 6-dehydrogenase
VRAYDPVASNRARSLLLAEHGATTCDAYLFIASSAHEAVEHADVLVVMTEWHEFRFPDFDKLARMLRSRAIFDARNIYDYRAVIAAGLYYEGIGRYVEQRRVDEAR